MHHYTKSDNVQTLSIYNQNAREQQHPHERKHLLALLSSFTREEEEVRREKVEELCCFDRMKKLISRRDSS
jgi:hypothetical protein